MIKDKPKIMLHIRASNNISGPNTSNRNIINSFLSEHYTFGVLAHDPVTGFFKNLFIVFSLVRQIRDFDPDVVHVSGLQRGGFEAVIAARFCRKKVLLTIHGSSTDVISFNKKFLYGKIIEPVTLKLSHKVYAVCDAMTNRGFIRKYANDRLIETIHNSAPIIDYSKIPSFGLRKNYNISDSAIVVVIVGRMVYDKGITFVEQAIRKISDKSIVFVFIGDGPSLTEVRDNLKDEISSNRVILLGQQSNVFPILKECDIFLFATLHENLSNALLEACSMGLAVIATEVGGNPEVIQDMKNGILIPPANTEKIVWALNLLIENDKLREFLGNQAIRTMADKFSQEKLLLKLGQVYAEMAE